jgi:hypothetical protein
LKPTCCSRSSASWISMSGASSLAASNNLVQQTLSLFPVSRLRDLPLTTTVLLRGPCSARWPLFAVVEAVGHMTYSLQSQLMHEDSNPTAAGWRWYPWFAGPGGMLRRCPAACGMGCA